MANPTVTLSPSTVAPGGTIQVNYAGFTAHSSVSVLGSPDGYSYSGTTDSSGAGSVVLDIPVKNDVGTVQMGFYTIRVDDLSGLSATATLNVEIGGNPSPEAGLVGPFFVDKTPPGTWIYDASNNRVSVATLNAWLIANSTAYTSSNVQTFDAAILPLDALAAWTDYESGGDGTGTSTDLRIVVPAVIIWTTETSVQVPCTY